MIAPAWIVSIFCCYHSVKGRVLPLNADEPELHRHIRSEGEYYSFGIQLDGLYIVLRSLNIVQEPLFRPIYQRDGARQRHGHRESLK